MRDQSRIFPSRTRRAGQLSRIQFNDRFMKDVRLLYFDGHLRTLTRNEAAEFEINTARSVPYDNTRSTSAQTINC